MSSWKAHVTISDNSVFMDKKACSWLEYMEAVMQIAQTISKKINNFIDVNLVWLLPISVIVLWRIVDVTGRNCINGIYAYTPFY